MKILIVEDDQIIAKNLKLLLAKEGFEVELLHDGSRVISMLQAFRFDLILLDWKLPDTSGDIICQKIRKNNLELPIIFLTSKNQIEDKVKALEIGGDDYVTKPFAFNELLARIKAHLRREAGDMSQSVLIKGELIIDTSKCLVRRGDTTIDLSPKLYDLLLYMAKNNDRVISRQELLENVWDESADLISNNIDSHIKILRQKVESGFKEKLIKTVKGKGYLLCTK